MTDADVQLDAQDIAPDVTASNESGSDHTARIAEEDGGAGATTYHVLAGRRLDRDGVILEAGADLQFRADEIATGVPAALIAAGVIA